MNKIYAIIAGLFLFASPVVAEITISDLPVASSLDGTEELLIFQSNVPYKTSGTTLTGSIDLPANVDIYDCTVDDDAGGADYTTINAAWAAGCRYMFIKNGTYTMTAATKLLETDPSTRIGLIGESVDGVTIDLNNNNGLLKITDGTKDNIVITDETLSINASSRTMTFAGTAASIAGWGVEVGDYVCPLYYDDPVGCYKIEEILTDTSVLLSFGYLGNINIVAEPMDNNEIFFHAYENVQVRDLRIIGTSNDSLFNLDDAGVTDQVLLDGLHLHNVVFGEDAQLVVNKKDGIQYAWIERVFSKDCCLYVGTGTVTIGGRMNDEAGNGYYTRAFVSGAFGNPNNVIYVGNTMDIDSGANFSTASDSVVIGNKFKGTDHATDPMVETLYGSLNLPGDLWMDGLKIFQSDSTIDNIAIGESTPDLGDFAQRGNIIIGTNVGATTSFPETNQSIQGNVIVGIDAADAANMEAYDSVVVGFNAASLIASTVGEQSGDNVIVGAVAAGGLTTGAGVVAIGTDAATNATGDTDASIFIGYGAGPLTPGEYDNKLYIDNHVTDTPIIYGDLSAGSEHITVNGDITATGQVALDGITFDYANYNQATTPGPGDTHTAGHVYFNTDDGTLDIMTDVSGTTIQVGQEVVIRVRNAEVDTLNDGEVVYMTGATSGDIPDVKRAQNDGTHAESEAVGLVTGPIAAGASGFVTCMGKVRGLDTATPEGATWNVGDVLYVDDTAGTLTKTKPVSPVHATIVGMVVRDHASNGIIFVSKPDSGYELDEIHNVDDAISPSLTTGTTLVWDNANSRWTDSETLTYTRHLQIPVTEVGNPAQIPDKDDIDGIVGCYAFDGGASVEELHLQFEVPDDWDGGDIIFEIDTAPMVAMIDTETYTFDVTYRAIAEGEVLTQGVAATRSSSYTSSGATAQYYFTHPQATLDYDDATQPLTKQDHIFIVIDRNDADSYASDVCVSAFEIIYESTGLPRI